MKIYKISEILKLLFKKINLLQFTKLWKNFIKLMRQIFNY